MVLYTRPAGLQGPPQDRNPCQDEHPEMPLLPIMVTGLSVPWSLWPRNRVAAATAAAVAASFVQSLRLIPNIFRVARLQISAPFLQPENISPALL